MPQLDILQGILPAERGFKGTDDFGINDTEFGDILEGLGIAKLDEKNKKLVKQVVQSAINLQKRKMESCRPYKSTILELLEIWSALPNDFRIQNLTISLPIGAFNNSFDLQTDRSFEKVIGFFATLRNPNLPVADSVYFGIQDNNKTYIDKTWFEFLTVTQNQDKPTPIPINIDTGGNIIRVAVESNLTAANFLELAFVNFRKRC